FPIHLGPAVRDVTVTRSFMSETFGGSSQGTFPKISAKNYALHGYKDFMYLNLEFNPNVPRLAGETGLWFSSRPAEGVRPIYRTFVRRDLNSWLYLGQYKVTAAASLTRQEWLFQSDIVRKTWATEILIRNWGKFVRASIILRRDRGREPTRDEVDAACQDGKGYKNVTMPEIIAAFDRGEQVLGVWTMQCVEYDENFQRRL
ncbi:hypothetical protein BV25DRAFT_1779002, partial [Artomyces pyxidatus]